MDLGAAHDPTGVSNPANYDSAIGVTGEVCDPEQALSPDGRSAGLARPGRGLARWDGHAVSACIEIDWAREIVRRSTVKSSL